MEKNMNQRFKTFCDQLGVIQSMSKLPNLCGVLYKIMLNNTFIFYFFIVTEWILAQLWFFVCLVGLVLNHNCVTCPIYLVCVCSKMLSSECNPLQFLHIQYPTAYFSSFLDTSKMSWYQEVGYLTILICFQYLV